MPPHLSPAADRNKHPILAVLTPLLPHPAKVLEIASGTGQHATFFAANLPHLTFQPTDTDPECLAQITALTAASGLSNVLPPLLLNAADPQWPALGHIDAIFCANMIHISPWASAQGLFAGVGRLRAPLFLYGPFRFNGAFTAPSNDEFDRSLKSRNPAWGVRDLSDLTELATAANLYLADTIAMPSNNHILIWRPNP